MNGTDALVALTRAFEDAEMAYMIVGSYSSNFYGIPRSTKDADLVVNLDQADWKKLSSILPPGLELEQERLGGRVNTSISPNARQSSAATRRDLRGGRFCESFGAST